MATKREVMLAGVPAKLAHMLASDPPTQLTPTGTDINSALLLESNWVVVNPPAAGDGAGFRLRPASGQFLHVVRNPHPYMINIYPDFTEQMNLRTAGNPWGLGPQQTGFFLPSRRQWLCGAMVNDYGTSMTGPVAIGVPAPADATLGDLFVGGVLAVALSSRPGTPVPTEGRLTFNAYWDAAGTWRYLADGPAFLFRYDTGGGFLALFNAPSGLADQPIPPWQPLGTPVAQFGTAAGASGTFLSGAVGMGRQAPTDALNGQLFLSELICMDLSARPGFTGNHGRLTFNAYWDVAGTWRYLDAGPAFLMRFNTTSFDLELLFAPAGSADQPITFGPNAMALTNPVPANMPAGQTALTLSMNEAGTIVTQPVLVSAANAVAGLPAGARVLYVAT